MGCAAALAALLLGIALDSLGRHAPVRRLRLAIPLLECWVLIPMTFAAVAAAGSIVVTVELSAPETAAAPSKELYGALAAAITAFLASGFVDTVSEDTRTSDRVRSHFQARYKDQFKQDSKAQQAVFAESVQGVEGWGRTARRKRADVIGDRWGEDQR